MGFLDSLFDAIGFQYTPEEQFTPYFASDDDAKKLVDDRESKPQAYRYRESSAQVFCDEEGKGFYKVDGNGSENYSGLVSMGAFYLAPADPEGFQPFEISRQLNNTTWVPCGWVPGDKAREVNGRHPFKSLPAMLSRKEESAVFTTALFSVLYGAISIGCRNYISGATALGEGAAAFTFLISFSNETNKGNGLGEYYSPVFLYTP